MSRASELLFSAKLIEPETAKEWGLISDFYKSDDLLKEANEIASSIIKQPPDALRMSKKLLREGMGASFDNILEMSASMQALMHLQMIIKKLYQLSLKKEMVILKENKRSIFWI